LGFINKDDNGQVIFSVIRPEGRRDIVIAALSSGRLLVQEVIPASHLDSLDDELRADFMDEIQDALLKRLTALRPARRRYVRPAKASNRPEMAC
jgi:hypothetical protein